MLSADVDLRIASKTERMIVATLGSAMLPLVLPRTISRRAPAAPSLPPAPRAGVSSFGYLDSMSDDWPAMVVKCHALSLKRLEHFGELRRTGRWRHYFWTEDALRRPSERRAPMSKNGSSLPIGVHRLTKRRPERPAVMAGVGRAFGHAPQPHAIRIRSEHLCCCARSGHHGLGHAREVPLASPLNRVSEVDAWDDHHAEGWP